MRETVKSVSLALFKAVTNCSCCCSVQLLVLLPFCLFWGWMVGQPSC